MSENKFENKINELLQNIQNLQEIEKELSTQLNNIQLSDEEKLRLLNKINELTQVRINLYGIINNLYSYYNIDLNESSNVLDKQLLALNIIENQLNNSKEKINELYQQKEQKLKLIKINTYYSKKYTAQKSVIKIISLVLFIIIIISILENKKILSNVLSKIIISITIVIGLYYILTQLFDILYRNNMNYDEYNWYFNKELAPKIYDSYEEVKDKIKEDDPWKIKECVGKEQCCNTEEKTNVENMCNLVGPNKFKSYLKY